MVKIAGYLFLLGIAILLSVSRYTLINTPVLENTPESKIIVTGDVMLGRTVMTKSLDAGDPTYPVTYVADRLREADLVFINLENPIIENCPRHYEGYIFCADPKMVQALTHAGVDVVTLANNHTLNYGKDGLEQTKKYLTAAGIEFVGNDNLVVKEVHGTTYGFLGFDFLTNPPGNDDFELVKTSSEQVDVLIVGVHWGAEYTAIPSELQRLWATQLVENGADVVVGHHPHWVQEFDRVLDKPVYYSLGNFIFDQMWSEATRSGMAIELTFQKDTFIRDEQLPVFMDEWARPNWTN